MAVQHLRRYLVRSSNGLKELSQTTKEAIFNFKSAKVLNKLVSFISAYATVNRSDNAN